MLTSEDAIELKAELDQFANNVGSTYISINFIRDVNISKHYTIGSRKPMIYPELESIELHIKLTVFGPNNLYDQEISKIIDSYGFIVGSCSEQVDHSTVTLDIHAFQTKEPDDIL